ncbi:MAG: hypothetical protein D6812_06930, partial [Deltaproteobacteria bacterium]
MNRKRQIPRPCLVAILLLLANTAGAQANGFDHTLYDRVLEKFVSDGRVDYRHLQQNREDLDRYLEAVAKFPEA